VAAEQDERGAAAAVPQVVRGTPSRVGVEGVLAAIASR
jgi:hypothetical protein